MIAEGFQVYLYNQAVIYDNIVLQNRTRNCKIIVLYKGFDHLYLKAPEETSENRARKIATQVLKFFSVPYNRLHFRTFGILFQFDRNLLPAVNSQRMEFFYPLQRTKFPTFRIKFRAIQ